ncbi:type VI secretion system ImpA family N-terminal domain-containing protein [Aeromonas caviae]|uniref:VasL domain-containing protein n=1 Tax=Aeromonas caviae TaxID=648 RepID=UPI001EF085AE|nr:VasL domain-containing protein [Aeromonas caviae]ULH02914.1 type VI secretion system ImpA family N-terminal domain-containing protein [Aeromonas caviae]
MSQNQQGQQALKVGRDPRMLPEYEALRAEINKLSHASRPEVDWQRIHQLASLIFEKHGVDLQTAIYFTLARSRLQGLSGFTEGCEFLANLIVTQWESFWPPVHQERARIEMLDWFIARISDVIRQYQISHEDKRLIYRCERALQLISEKLHNADLSRIPRVENLVHFIEGYTHLFDETEIVIVSDEPGLKEDLQIPPMVFFKSDLESEHGGTVSTSTPHLPQGSILVGREKGQVKPTVLKIEQHRRQRPAWFWFGCGLLSCALPVMGWLGWQQHQQEKTVAAQRLVQPAAELPRTLSYDDIRQARIVLGEQTLQNMESDLVARYQNQLTRLEQTSPLYWYRYGEGLRNSLSMLYPDSLAVKALDKQWQAQLGGQQGDVISVPTYLDARAGVDALLDQLLELERQRKTVTISYLKSQLYEVQKNLMQNIPFSLRLGELEARKASQEPITAAELKSLENDLKALNIRLYQLQQGASGS